MAKNGAHGSGYLGVIQRQSKVGKPKSGTWVERDIAEGRFKNDVHGFRKSLKGIPREV